MQKEKKKPVKKVHFCNSSTWEIILSYTAGFMLPWTTWGSVYKNNNKKEGKKEKENREKGETKGREGRRQTGKEVLVFTF